MLFRVYDKNDEYFPLFEADESVNLDKGIAFIRDGVTVAYFSKDIFGGFIVESEGEWTEKYIEECDNPFLRRRWYCSKCGKYQTYGETDYCPRCGACMRKSGEKPEPEAKSDPAGKWWINMKQAYTCPDCGACEPIEAPGHEIICSKCGKELAKQ